MNMTSDLAAVAVALAAYKDSFDAVTYEYPGYIQIAADGAIWTVGTANGPIGADYYNTAESFADGASPNRSIEIAVPVDATAEQIAEAIYSALIAE